LDAIEAYEEGFGCCVGVGGEAREDEGDTVGGFVVYDFGFVKGWRGGRSVDGGYRGHFERIIMPLKRAMGSRIGSGLHREIQVKLQSRLRVTPGRFGEFTPLWSGARCGLCGRKLGDLHMKKQSQNDYYYTIAQICKTNDTNKFKAFDSAREQKTQVILHVNGSCSQRFWCGALATLVMGSSFV
jgi:hypothetical protein